MSIQRTHQVFAGVVVDFSCEKLGSSCLRVDRELFSLALPLDIDGLGADSNSANNS